MPKTHNIRKPKIVLPDYPELKDKHIFVSGGDPGIGAELVSAYAKNAVLKRGAVQIIVNNAASDCPT